MPACALRKAGHAKWRAGACVTYSVKEIFYTLQGEGANAGRPAVFCRFAGCNLWSGLERDRATAICQFCDTDFVGTDGTRGGKFTSADALADVIASEWPTPSPRGARVAGGLHGGEPLLQLDAPLIVALHARGFEIAVETNGTIAAPEGIDWICVSPKGGHRSRAASRSGTEGSAAAAARLLPSCLARFRASLRATDGRPRPCAQYATRHRLVPAAP